MFKYYFTELERNSRPLNLLKSPSNLFVLQFLLKYLKKISMKMKWKLPTLKIILIQKGTFLDFLENFFCFHIFSSLKGSRTVRIWEIVAFTNVIIACGGIRHSNVLFNNDSHVLLLKLEINRIYSN